MTEPDSEQRRRFVGGAACALLLAALPARAQYALPPVTVYKSPSCGCCNDWVKHMRANGFRVDIRDVDDVDPLKSKFGVPKALGSCHTAVVGGYAIEGHVPAADIKRLLAEKPRAQGLAVPGMPAGSPGMEGNRSDPYDVLLFQDDGRHTVYRSYGRKTSTPTKGNRS